MDFLCKVANHAVPGNIGSLGQIHLFGNMVRYNDPGFKLSIIDKGSWISGQIIHVDGGVGSLRLFTLQ
jgi:hypothetical protein